MRVLLTKMNPAAMNMAIDEAVLESVALGVSEPTLRLYGWSPAAISIGYFQSLIEEVDTDASTKMGIDVVRRMTGGGAVFHEHEITYSIHIPEKSGLVPLGILESYRAISEGIIKGLAHASISAQFVPLNDLVVGPKKISGNAQTRKQGVIVQHGTILLRVDVEKMFSLLKVPSEKMKGKLIADIKERVTSLSQVLGREVSFDEAEKLLLMGFEETFGSEKFVVGSLTSTELARATTLVKEKYGASQWNNKK